MKSKSFSLPVFVFAFCMVIAHSAIAQGAPKPQYQEGIHYTPIENAPVASGDKVLVVEAFSYMCSHCGTFEPYISNWLGRKPAHVEFKRIPVIFGRGSWDLYARAYVTAEVMGIADKAHGALMDRIWKEKVISRNMDELAEFYAGFGVKASEFVATSKSFAVDAKLRKEQTVVQESGVHGTPSLIVAQKYLVAGNEAVANYDAMLSVVDFLIAKEYAERKLATPAAASANEPAKSGEGNG
jgi:protein dithiol oxidoreductase (disulfide-forming)